MAGRIPRAYVEEAQQNNSTMVYVNGGDFAKMGIGARSSGLPKGDAAPNKTGMNLEHVGGTAGKK